MEQATYLGRGLGFEPRQPDLELTPLAVMPQCLEVISEVSGK